MALGKNDLVGRVADQTGLPKAQVAKTVDALLDEVQKATGQGESISLRGFGTFSQRQQAARMGRNPRTGAEIQIPARSSLGFKASKSSSNA
jgi:DNA-binding protein HU-beta